MSQTKAFMFSGAGFAVGAIAFAMTGNWLLALSFAVIAVSFILKSTQAGSGSDE